MIELRCARCRKLLGHYSRGTDPHNMGLGRLFDQINPADGIAYFNDHDEEALLCPRHGPRTIDRRWLRSPHRGRTRSEEIKTEVLL